MSVQVTNLIFDYTRAGSTCYVRWYADSAFVDSDGITHPAQAAGGQDYLVEATCSVVSGRATAATFTLPETWDEVTNLRATLTACVLDANRKKAFILVSGYRVPGSLGGTITWEQLAIYNATHATLRDTSVYTKEQVNALIASVASNFKGTYTKATLPTSGATAGWLAYVSDDVRGLWMYNGVKWRAVGSEINLYDCGAVGDGTTNDSAALSLALALLASSPNNGVTLKIPPGKFRIATPVVVSLGLRGTHAKIEGSAGRSALYIDVSATQDALTFSAAENLSIQDLVIVGHVNDQNDCKHAVVITNCEQVSFKNVQFYGVYAATNGAVLKINNSSVYMRDCAFKGCSGSNLTTAIIRILLHRAFSANNIIFKDFGVYDNEFYSKTPGGLPNWIELNSVQGGALSSQVSDMTSQGEFLIDGFRGDEGAIKQVIVDIPDGQKRLTRAVIRNANVNQSGLDGSTSLYFSNVDEARVEDSWLGYSTNPSRIGFTFREVRRAIIRNTTMAEGVSVIEFGTSTPYAELENVRFVRVVGSPLDTFIDGAWGNLLFADSRNTYLKTIVRDKVSEGQAFLLAAAGATTYKEYVQGALRVAGLTKPVISSVTPNPAAGVTYTYWVVAVDRFGRRVISDPVTITNGPVALNVGNFNRVQWNAVGGAVEYRVLRNSVTSYAHVIAPVNPADNSFTFDDTGAVTDTYFLVEGNETADVQADGNVIAGTGLRVGGESLIKKVKKGTVVIDPNLVTAGGIARRTATLTGARVGDSLVLNAPAAGLNTIILAGYEVSATDQIAATFFNPSGGGVVHTAETFNYILFRS